jgi:hypothetical protein
MCLNRTDIHGGEFAGPAARCGIECAWCGDWVIAPCLSQYVPKQTVRHLWCCSRCGHEFETSVSFGDHALLAPDLVEQFMPSLLVS